MATDPELHRFLNRLKILHGLERYEIEASMDRKMHHLAWGMFRDNPSQQFLNCDDPTQAAIWRAVKARETR